MLSLVAFLLIIAIFIKVDNYKTRSYKIDVFFKSDDIVVLTNKLPISEDIGKNYTGVGVEKGIVEYKEFTISNPNDRKVSYEIYLTKISNSTDDIRSNYIRLYLTDEENNPIEGFGTKKGKTYYDLYSFNNQPGSKLLYTGTLVSGGTKKFILRSWVDDTYVLSEKAEDFTFDIGARIK